ncbi:cobalamin biosynthesis protein [Aestuariivita sp.]|jgi:cobalt-precorrin 5A hydrolase|uniref:cobalamin biosynthesis protein n=1 Tax=Aestuariivita sp. TaxID=1872407 RepID=UPI00216D4A97|nr:cobalamin biosynthesis protein [Aestuariivita sp.]MCE8009624.1 cobalamin biosynthesis protein [Aestuariivita sp.]
MIVAGFGFNAQARVDSLLEAMALAGPTPDGVATLVGKADGEIFARFADLLGRRAIFVAAVDAQAQSTLTKSDRSIAAHGVGSVAEACALAAAGPGAKLLGPRVISADRTATCALAERSER